ncbi:MAG: hypothetical protein HC916_01335 [Coleofasciculaceae cyanobacterium SM2_1_6]|nr:hypothetical protein [Coleofasciculaceae cyanobacterium SM2_1_6]
MTAILFFTLALFANFINLDQIPSQIIVAFIVLDRLIRTRPDTLAERSRIRPNFYGNDYSKDRDGEESLSWETPALRGFPNSYFVLAMSFFAIYLGERS